MDVAWLHGYTMSSRIFEPVWPLLPGVRHHGIDLPGHGRAATEALSTLPAMAASVAGQLQAGGCRVLVGLSFGSCVALQVALDHPGLLDGLVLAAPTLAGVADDPAARAKYLLLATLYRQLGPGPQLAAIWMSDPPAIFTGLRAHPEAFDAMSAVIAEHSFAELGSGAMRALTAGSHDAGRLAGLRVPTLVLIGDQDMPRFRDAAALLGATVPDVEVVQVPDAGHLPLLERPAGCAATVARFLGRIGAEVSAARTSP